MDRTHTTAKTAPGSLTHWATGELPGVLFFFFFKQWNKKYKILAIEGCLMCWWNCGESAMPMQSEQRKKRKKCLGSKSNGPIGPFKGIGFYLNVFSIEYWTESRSYTNQDREKNCQARWTRSLVRKLLQRFRFEMLVIWTRVLSDGNDMQWLDSVGYLFIYLFWSCLWHVEVPLPVIKPTPQW